VTETNGVRYTTREAIERLESRMDARFAELEHSIDRMAERQNQMLGASGLVRWLAPVAVGVIGVVLTLVASGVHP
jgi:hypothetical protein